MHSLRAFNDRRKNKRALKAANSSSEDYYVNSDSPTHLNVGYTKGKMSSIQEGSEAGANLSRKERYAAAIKETDAKFGKVNTSKAWDNESAKGKK